MNKMMKTDRVYKVICSCLIVTLIVALFAVPCFAAGDVAGAIESTWNAAKGQIKQVTNNVIFPALDMILAILFFVKVGSSYFEYKKHGQLECDTLAVESVLIVFIYLY